MHRSKCSKFTAQLGITAHAQTRCFTRLARSIMATEKEQGSSINSISSGKTRLYIKRCREFCSTVATECVITAVKSKLVFRR